MGKLTAYQEAEICRRYQAGEKIMIIEGDLGLNDYDLYKVLGRNHVPHRCHTKAKPLNPVPDTPSPDPPAPPAAGDRLPELPPWDELWPSEIKVNWLAAFIALCRKGR